MVYLFYGQETYLINKEIKKILFEHQIDKINTNHYDLELNLLDDVIEDAGMISMFGDMKAIIVNNAYIFTGKKNLIEQNTDILDKYLDQINESTILFFVVDSEKLDERKKINKTIKEKGSVRTFIKVGNLTNLAKEMFDDYQISASDLNLLLEYVGKNLDLLEQEINKLKMYRYNEKEIETADITSLVAKNIDLDMFGFIDHIVLKNKEQAITIYHEMLKVNEEPIKIVVMLANQFRIMYQAKGLATKGYQELEIAQTLDIHPYRVKLALEKGRVYSSSLLLSYLNQLADLDEKIKSGLIDKELGLELFILGL